MNNSTYLFDAFSINGFIAWHSIGLVVGLFGVWSNVWTIRAIDSDVQLRQSAAFHLVRLVAIADTVNCFLGMETLNSNCV